MHERGGPAAPGEGEPQPQQAGERTEDGAGQHAHGVTSHEHTQSQAEQRKPGEDSAGGTRCGEGALPAQERVDAFFGVFGGAFQARGERRAGALAHAQAQLQVVQALVAVRAHPGAVFEQLGAGEVRGGTPGGDRGKHLRKAANIFGAPLLPVVIGEGGGASCASNPEAFLCGCFLRGHFLRTRHRFTLPELPGARVGVHRLLQGNTGAQVQREGA